MMRQALLAIGTAALLAGCSEAPAPAPKAAASAAALTAGLWKTDSEVTQFKAMDKGRPIVAARAGTKASAETCIAAAETKRPSPTLFGATGPACDYANVYVGNGTLSGTIDCKSPQGSVMHTINGSFDDRSLTAVVDTASYLTSEGDITMSTRITGTRAGQC